MIVRKGDTVGVLSGRDRGKRGIVERVLPAELKVVVSGVNVRTHHVKPSKAHPGGGIIKAEAPLHSAKVMVACPSCQKLTRTRTLVAEDGGKTRSCTHCAGTLDAPRA